MELIEETDLLCGVCDVDSKRTCHVLLSSGLQSTFELHALFAERLVQGSNGLAMQ